MADGRTCFFKFIPADDRGRARLARSIAISCVGSIKTPGNAPISLRASYKVSFYFHAGSHRPSGPAPPGVVVVVAAAGVKSGKRPGLRNSATNFHTKSPDETEFRGEEGSKSGLCLCDTSGPQTARRRGQFLPFAILLPPRLAMTMIELLPRDRGISREEYHPFIIRGSFWLVRYL